MAVERTTGRARFRAVRAACRIDDDVAYLPREAREALGAEPGERVHTIPFE